MRNSVSFEEYYDILSDLIRVWWEFHLLRMSNGDLPYSGKINSENKWQAFDFNQSLKDAYEKTGKPVDILSIYTTEIKNSFDASLSDLLNPNPEIRDKYGSLIDLSYARILKKRGVEGIKALPYDASTTVKDVMVYGANTGLSMGVYLNALFGGNFNSITMMMLSKVEVEHIKTTQRETGQKGSQDYSLIDTTNDKGVRVARLQELGMGRVRGCPAARRVTSECQEFLEHALLQFGVQKEISGTMLEEFGKVMAENFLHDVLEPFENLSDEDKANLIEGNTKLLDGIILQELKERDRIRENNEHSAADPHRK